MQTRIGAALAALVALIAYRNRSLTRSGAVAAFALGTAIFGARGWRGAAVLFAFFLPSTLLSHVGRRRKRAIVADGIVAGRSGWQVLANGGVAAICAALGARGDARFSSAFAGAFAAASADTWGTEIGTLARHAPVSILTFRTVAAGRSGGITLPGSIATLGGALCVAVTARFVGLAPAWNVTLGGIAGALLDSFLGASLQALRWCPACECECETQRHRCGAATTLRRGVSWLENDAVNFAATLCGAAVTSLTLRAP
jgi:uncharacterized protein (TIGR00297 family)